MADVRPFHAVIFRPDAPEMAAWTSTAPEPLSKLTAAEPEFSILSQGDGGKTESSAAWSDSALRRVPAEASGPAGLFVDRTEGYFAYRQSFRSEGGLERTRLGLVGQLQLGERAPPPLLTQDTEPFGVDWCAREIQASGLQLRPVVAGVEDTESELPALLERAILERENPDLRLELPEGESHKLWKIEDPGLVREVTSFLAPKDAFLLDGLHGLRALRRVRPDAPSPVTVFFNLFDLSITFSSSVLLYPELHGFNINDLILRLNPAFEVKTFPFQDAQGLPRALADFREDVRLRGFTESVVGAFFAGVDHFFLFQLREGVERDRIFLPDVPLPLREFDSVLLRKVIVEGHLCPGAEARAPEYCWSLEEAVAAVLGGRFGSLFLVNPPNKRKLASLARDGLRLPPGSLRLEPPVRSRLLMAGAAQPA